MSSRPQDLSSLLLEANAHLKSGDVVVACKSLRGLMSSAHLQEKEIPVLAYILAIVAMMTDGNIPERGSLPPPPISPVGDLRQWCREYVEERAWMSAAQGKAYSADVLAWGLARVEDELSAAGWVVDRTTTPPLDFAMQGLLVETSRAAGRRASVSDLHDIACRLRAEFENLEASAVPADRGDHSRLSLQKHKP